MNHTWLISDTHFGHDMLFKKGFRPESFGGLIMTNTLRELQPGDNLICLGDVFIGPRGRIAAEQFIEAVSKTIKPGGRSVLIRGNHDVSSCRRFMAMGFDWACDAMMWEIHGQSVYFSHRPMATFPGDVNIHGHCHGNGHRERPISEKPQIEIAPELLDYRPVTLQSVLELGATPEFSKGRLRRWNGLRKGE